MKRSFSNIKVIARATFRLEVRNRIFYAAAGFALLYFLFTLFLSQLVLKEPQMVKSFCLAGTYFFGIITALFLGTSSLYKDLDERIAYFILSKPVTRREFILGKYLGLCLLMGFLMFIMAWAYASVVWYELRIFDWWGMIAILFQYLEILVFLSFALFVASFASSLVSMVVTSAVFFVGHFVSSLIQNAQDMNISGISYRLIEALYYIFPNLEKFNIRSLGVHEQMLSLETAVWTLLYAASYIIFLLFLASWILEEREL